MVLVRGCETSDVSGRHLNFLSLYTQDLCHQICSHHNKTVLSRIHNGHKNAKFMHFRSEKVASVRQFLLFLLIMHYLKNTKPTVQVNIPFKNQSNTQIYVEFFACFAWNFFQLKYSTIFGHK